MSDKLKLMTTDNTDCLTPICIKETMEDKDENGDPVKRHFTLTELNSLG